MTETVRLREVEQADLELFFLQEQDPEAVRRSRFTPREREAFLTHWTTRVLPNPTGLVRTVTVDGAVAGSVMTWLQEERRFVGYWLDRRYWGRGVGTEMLGLLLRLDPHRPLYADPHQGNTASVRLLERHGFRRVGTDGEQVVLVLGEAAAAGPEL